MSWVVKTVYHCVWKGGLHGMIDARKVLRVFQIFVLPTNIFSYDIAWTSLDMSTDDCKKRINFMWNERQEMQSVIRWCVLRNYSFSIILSNINTNVRYTLMICSLLPFSLAHLLKYICCVCIRQGTHTSHSHYGDVRMGAIASQITGLAIFYSAFYSGADQRKHQSSASLAFVQGIHRGPVNSPLKGPVTRKMFPFDDVIKHFQFPPDDFSFVLLVVTYNDVTVLHTMLMPQWVKTEKDDELASPGRFSNQIIILNI